MNFVVSSMTRAVKANVEAQALSLANFPHPRNAC